MSRDPSPKYDALRAMREQEAQEQEAKLKAASKPKPGKKRDAKAEGS
jgi:hypothetical protein